MIFHNIVENLCKETDYCRWTTFIQLSEKSPHTGKKSKKVFHISPIKQTITMKPLEVELGNVTTANVQQLKTINIHTLPVRYSDKFYKDIIQDLDSKILKFAFYNGFAVGAVCARIEPHEQEGFKKLYIMTINVLAAYRRRGIATTLLNHALEEAKKKSDIIEVYLHVQTSNFDAKNFYLSHGFIEVDMIENYYRNIDPPHSYLLKKSLKDGHVVSASNTNSVEKDME